MSLQSNVTSWLNSYNNTNPTGPNATKSIGSILTVDNIYHTGGFGESNSIYDPGSTLPYEIYDFKWYAGQGLNSSGVGSKFLAYSECGMSWDTVDLNGNGKYEFVTTGSIDTLYLGRNADTGYSPAETTLTSFNSFAPLTVISNFDVAVDYVANLFQSGANGNTQINVSLLNDGTNSIISYPQYYEKVTLNSAIIYDLTFDESAASTSTFEYVLATYLNSFSSGAISINDDINDINTYLNNNGSDLHFEYYAMAGSYATGGVVTEELAQQHLNTSECDLLLAA